MYKLIATWSAPSAEDEDAFEQHYQEVHATKAAAVPHLEKLILTRTSEGLEGGEPAFYRVAEMMFTDERALQESSESPEFIALREDAGEMIERFGVSLDVGIGWQTENTGKG